MKNIDDFINEYFNRVDFRNEGTADSVNTAIAYQMYLNYQKDKDTATIDDFLSHLAKTGIDTGYAGEGLEAKKQMTSLKLKHRGKGLLKKSREQLDKIYGDWRNILPIELFKALDGK